MKLVLDTSIYCDYAEGIPDIVETIANSGEIIYLPAIIIAELSFGFMNGNKQEYNERKLQYIIDQLQIEIINVNQNIARKYALIYFHLVKKGRKYPLTMCGLPPVAWNQELHFSLGINILNQLN